MVLNCTLPAQPHVLTPIASKLACEVAGNTGCALIACIIERQFLLDYMSLQESGVDPDYETLEHENGFDKDINCVAHLEKHIEARNSGGESENSDLQIMGRAGQPLVVNSESDSNNH